MDLLGGYGTDSEDENIVNKNKENNQLNSVTINNQNNNISLIQSQIQKFNATSIQSNDDIDQSTSTSLFSNMPKFIKKSVTSLLPANKTKKIKKSKLIDIEAIKQSDPDLFIKNTNTDHEEPKKEEKASVSNLSWLPAPKTQVLTKKLQPVMHEEQASHQTIQQQHQLPKQPAQVEEPTIYYSDASIYNLAEMDDQQIAALQQAQAQQPYNPYNRPEWEISTNTDVSNLTNASIEDPVAKKFLNELNKSSANNARIYSISHSDVFNKVKAEAAMPQPTCTNKRRHHISELVEHATILHDEIMIKSAQRQNSKRAAAQRYGW